MKKIDNFLIDLQALLTQYNAAIVRSADEAHKLVVCVENKGVFDEVEFEDDITEFRLSSKQYSDIRQKD